MSRSHYKKILVLVPVLFCIFFPINAKANTSGGLDYTLTATSTHNSCSNPEGIIQLSWNLVNDTTNYILYQKTGTDPETSIVVMQPYSGNSISKTVTGLYPGAIYRYYVVASSSLGQLASSTYVFESASKYVSADGTTPCPPPSADVTLSASPTSVDTGASSTLTWVPSNATSCTASGGWSGNKNASTGINTEIISNITSTTTYDLYCSNSTGASATRSVQVGINYYPPPPPTPQPVTVNIYTNPTKAKTPVTTTDISWKSSNADICVGSGSGFPAWDGVSIGSNGLMVFTIASPTTFKISCNNKTYSSSASVSVGINRPAVKSTAANTTPTCSANIPNTDPCYTSQVGQKTGTRLYDAGTGKCPDEFQVDPADIYKCSFQCRDGFRLSSGECTKVTVNPI